MATVRQYFETDFSHVVRIHVKFALSDKEDVEALWLVDFLGYLSLLTCYVPGEGRSLDFYLRLVRALDYDRTQLIFQGAVGLPAARQFPGQLTIENKSPLRVCAQFFGDPASISANDVQMSTRIFIYSETQLSEEEVAKLKEEGRRLGHEVQFRSKTHEMMRSRQDKPMAFISYDSRDRDIAQSIAIGLQRLMCSVWYDEFSLKVGDNLRDRLKKG
jgi:hypothetical protein